MSVSFSLCLWLVRERRQDVCNGFLKKCSRDLPTSPLPKIVCTLKVDENPASNSLSSPRRPAATPPSKVAELSVVVDSAFLFDVPGYLTPFLEYLQKNPSAAYGDHCSEVRTWSTHSTLLIVCVRISFVSRVLALKYCMAHLLCCVAVMCSTPFRV